MKPLKTDMHNTEAWGFPTQAEAEAITANKNKWKKKKKEFLNVLEWNGNAKVHY